MSIQKINTSDPYRIEGRATVKNASYFITKDIADGVSESANDISIGADVDQSILDLSVTSASGIASTNDSNVDVFSSDSILYKELNIINEGAAAGFVSIDNGQKFARMPANSASKFSLPNGGVPSSYIKVKRTPGGSNISSIFAWGS